MEENNEVLLDTDLETEETENPEIEQLNDEQEEEVITIPKKKWDEIQNQKRHWKNKAEEGKPRLEKPVETQAEVGITPKDVLVLTGAGIIHEEDVSRVEQWAKFNKQSVAEALKDPILKTVLDTQKEQRATAMATQTKTSNRGMTSDSPDAIVAKARKGQLDTSDNASDEEIEALAQAEQAQKLAKLR